MAADDKRYDHGGNFINCGTFQSQLCVPHDNLEDLGDILLPNSSNSISWSELELDSDGEIRLVGDVERNPVSPTLTFNNNGVLDSDGEIRLVSASERNPVSPTLMLNDYGGHGSVEENTRQEEVKGGKFPLDFSKEVHESNHRNLDGQRQQWKRFSPVVPNFPDSPSSGSTLSLDSDGEIWSLDDFERNQVSLTLILNKNGGDGTVEANSREEKVSPTLILNNNGGDGTVQENTREEEVKVRKFPLGISSEVRKSSHRNFGGQRQKWGNSHRVSPFSWSSLMSDFYGEIKLSDDFDRYPVSPTFFLNDNGGNGKVEENTWEDEAKGRTFTPDFSEKAPESNHRSWGGGKQRISPSRRCMHCQTDDTPQWRVGPKGPKTLCNACGVRYKSGRLLPEYRPAASPTFDSSKHSNFHRKITRNLIRCQA